MNGARGLCILVWSCDLERPEGLATPFMLAQAARALDTPVKMLFSAQSVGWLLAQHGQMLVGFGAQRWSIERHLVTSAELGVEIHACSQALAALEATPASLSAACGGVEGMVAFVEQGQQPGWQMLVF